MIGLTVAVATTIIFYVACLHFIFRRISIIMPRQLGSDKGTTIVLRPGRAKHRRSISQSTPFSAAASQAAGKPAFTTIGRRYGGKESQCIPVCTQRDEDVVLWAVCTQREIRYVLHVQLIGGIETRIHRSGEGKGIIVIKNVF
jgi:hypothetical protein